MVLVSKPKRKPSIHQKRRTGKHQHQTKDFHKPYWPYLPMIGVIGLGAVANAWLSAPVGQPTIATVYNMGATTRAESWFGSLSVGALLTILGVAVAAALFVIFRHGKAWSKAFAKSEAFVLHHPLLDIVLVAFAVGGFVLTGNLL